MEATQKGENVENGYNSDANSLFPSKEYLKRFTDPTADPMKVHSKFLKAWHDFYQKYANGIEGSKSLLEFGGGPTLHSLVTACKHVGSITFADYAESNRNEIILWKDKKNERHDWSNYIKYVVRNLEGDTSEGADQSREKELREKLTEVTSCNIRSESFLDSEPQNSQFDVIHTNLCLEIACESKDEFYKCLRKLGDLLKPGGYFVMLTAKGGAWYTCAGAGSKLFQLELEESDILKAVEMSGLSLVESYNIEPAKNPLSATKSFQFTIAQKQK